MATPIRTPVATANASHNRAFLESSERSSPKPAGSSQLIVPTETAADGVPEFAAAELLGALSAGRGPASPEGLATEGSAGGVGAGLAGCRCAVGTDALSAGTFNSEGSSTAGSVLRFQADRASATTASGCAEVWRPTPRPVVSDV